MPVAATLAAMASDGARPDVERMRRLLADAAAAVGEALVASAAAAAGSSGPSMRQEGERPGQYLLDLATDAAALEVLRSGGVGVLSEESGHTGEGAAVTVVVDPVDGSTNASRHLPWHATSLCAVDGDGPWVSLVVNLATGTRWEAVRGAGATRDGAPVHPAGTRQLRDAVVVLNGMPRRHLGWRQYRALGATALDLCCVADGSVDATIDCTTDALGPWDYLGAALVIAEAGGQLVDLHGRDLVVLEHSARRTPVSACTPELLEEALAARRDAA